MSETIVNKVAASGLVNFDLESLALSGARKSLDISSWLWQEMIIKEKEFKQHIANHDWEQYQGAVVNVYCSVDAIIPNWAYMLVVAQLTNVAKYYHLGSADQLEESIFISKIQQLDTAAFKDKRVLIKGCSDGVVPPSAYIALSQRLLPVVKSLMYGEACSNVPVYKSK